MFQDIEIFFTDGRTRFMALNRMYEVTKIGIKTRFCCPLSKFRIFSFFFLLSKLGGSLLEHT